MADTILTVSEGQLLFVHSLIYWATTSDAGGYAPGTFDPEAHYKTGKLLDMNNMRTFDDYTDAISSGTPTQSSSELFKMIPNLEGIQVKGQDFAEDFVDGTKDFAEVIRKRDAYKFMEAKVEGYLQNEQLTASRTKGAEGIGDSARDQNAIPGDLEDIAAADVDWISFFENAVITPLTDDFTSDTSVPYWSGPRARATAKAQTRFDVELVGKRSEWEFQWRQVVVQAKDKMYDRRATARDAKITRDVDYEDKMINRRSLYRDNRITRQIGAEEQAKVRMIQMFDAGAKFVNLERDELLKRALVGMQAGELQRGIYSQRRMIEFQNWLRQQPLMNPALEYAMTASGQPLYTAVGGGGGGGSSGGGGGGSDYSWVAPLAQGGFGFLSQLIFN